MLICFLSAFSPRSRYRLDIKHDTIGRAWSLVGHGPSFTNHDSPRSLGTRGRVQHQLDSVVSGAILHEYANGESLTSRSGHPGNEVLVTTSW
jgi:hypothetical protein